MDLIALLRRTNTITINHEQGLIIKKYRDYPYTVMPQVALGLRSRDSLDATYRCQTEQRKVRFLQDIGFPLAQEYLYFEESKYEPMVVARYVPNFLNVEDKIRQGMSREEALTLVGKCAAQLQALHQVAKSNGEIKITHGDPYLENMRYYPDGSVRWFDFEHQYTVIGSNALAMDGAIFVGHAVQVLRDCGHIKNKQEHSDLRDVIEQHYSGLRMDAPQGRAYLRLRFGK